MVAETVQIRTPRTKVLGSQQAGRPADVSVIEADLRIAPVRSFAGADIGVNAILSGVAEGREAVVGAGTVLTKDVSDFATVAGVPARVVGRRKP
jgi:acetyltransferase-like isoleucine patch superfamily enzyme